MLTQEAPQTSEQILVEYKQDIITTENMLSYWKDTIAFINTLSEEEQLKKKTNLSLPASQKRRAHVRVIRPVQGPFKQRVDSLEAVEEMIGSITQWFVEPVTESPNNSQLIRGILPIDYEIRVAYLRLRDIPVEASLDGHIDVVKERNEEGKIEYNYYCKAIHPFNPLKEMKYVYHDKNNDLQFEVLSTDSLRKYHCVTFNVNLYEEGENGIINSWDTGLNKNSQTIFNDEDRFVMLGHPK